MLRSASPKSLRFGSVRRCRHSVPIALGQTGVMLRLVRLSAAGELRFA